MKPLLLGALLLTSCTTEISVPPLDSDHPAQAGGARASSPALQPYLISHRTGVAEEDAATPTQQEAPMDHSKMKMEGM